MDCNVKECQLLKLKDDLGLVLADCDISDYTIKEVTNQFFGIEPLYLVRDEPLTGLGRLYFRDVFLCDTLENPDFLMPCGTYPLFITYSQKFKANLPEFKIKGHSGLRIHQGNYIKDSKGCVLVGERRSLTLQHSVATLARVIYIINSLSIMYFKIC